MKEYRLIQKNDPEQLSHEVNGYFRVGWDLHGPTTITSAGSHGIYAQAMIREVTSNEKKPSSSNQ